MKNTLILILSFLCLTICSCQKEEPRDMIIGTWDVTATITDPSGYSEESKGWSFTFREDGTGTVSIADVLDFTYQYISETNTIRYSMDGVDKVMYVDALTKDSFIIHTTENAKVAGTPMILDYVFTGTKVK